VEEDWAILLSRKAEGLFEVETILRNPASKVREKEKAMVSRFEK
jgi:hypothetical protein